VTVTAISLGLCLSSELQCSQSILLNLIQFLDPYTQFYSQEHYNITIHHSMNLLLLPQKESPVVHVPPPLLLPHNSGLLGSNS
jgi:hypothetical protein